MTNVPNSIATELLTSAPAANEDRVEDAEAPSTPHSNQQESSQTSLSETGGWDAHEVWRRFIKEARERRRAEQPPER